MDSTGTYSFLSGTLAGSVPLFKRGTGLLILDSNNTISSPTSIEGGQLQIGNGNSRGAVGTRIDYKLDRPDHQPHGHAAI